MLQRQIAVRLARLRPIPSQWPERHGRKEEAAAAVKEQRLQQYEGVLPSRPVVVIDEHFRRLQVPQRLWQRLRPYPLRLRISQETLTKPTGKGAEEEEASAQEVMRISTVDAEALQEDAIEIAEEKKRAIPGQVEIAGGDPKKGESLRGLTETEEMMEVAGTTVLDPTGTEIERAIEVMAAERAELMQVLLVAELIPVRMVAELFWLVLSLCPVFLKLKRLPTYQEWSPTLPLKSSVFFQELLPLFKSTKYRKP